MIAAILIVFANTCLVIFGLLALAGIVYYNFADNDNTLIRKGR